MAKLERTIGSTSQVTSVFIADSSSTTGAGLTGLVFNTSGLTAAYHRPGDATVTSITLATATLGTWTSGGFKEKDATKMPGHYEFGVPDACHTVMGGVDICFTGGANVVQSNIELQIVGSSKGNSAALAQAGGASTITLATTADATDSFYNGQQIQLLAGTGVRQVRTVISYVGSTKVATLDRAWATNPDNTSYYAILPHTAPKLSTSLGTMVAGYESGQDPATLVLGATIDTTGGWTSSQKVKDAMKAAWSTGIGNITQTGTSLAIYAPDGTTALKTFTLDSSTNPQSRS